MGRGGAEEIAEDIPLLIKNQKESDEDHIKRTGTVYTALAHIITTVVGTGVLSLAWSVAQLGWIAGPTAIILFATVTLVPATLLANCYRSPDPEHGHNRNLSYVSAVKQNLGEKSLWFSAFFQLTSLYGGGIVSTITAATSIRAIWQANCYHRQGREAPCSFEVTSFMLLFGVSQILLSQIPDFHNMAWLSFLAAFMSFTYSFIGFGLGLAKVIVNGTIKGEIGGVPTRSTAQKVWKVSQGLADIIFAYPYTLLILEIENTLKSPPPENQTMNKASRIAIFITTVLYLCCGCFGYAAFGNDTPGNLLSAFGFYEPYWLIDFANACIIIHLIGGYQICSQPVYALIDRWLSKRIPSNGFVNDFYVIKLPLLPSYRMSLLRLCYRTLYVISTTIIAMLFPYFNQVMGVLGAFNFWPVAVYFPVQIYLVQRKLDSWSRKWVLLQMFSYGCLIVCVFAFVGSVQGILSKKLS